MSEAENNTQASIWKEVYAGWSNGKENALVLKKYPEELGSRRVQGRTILMLFIGVLVLVIMPFLLPNLETFIFYHGFFVAFFLVLLGNTWGQSVIVGHSPDYIKFLRWITAGLWLYIIGWIFPVNHPFYFLIPFAATGMAVLAFLKSSLHFSRYKREIQKWKDAPEKLGLRPLREYTPYRFLIFEEGNDARLFEYRGNIRKLGLIYKFPYEEKQANTKGGNRTGTQKKESEVNL